MKNAMIAIAVMVFSVTSQADELVFPFTTEINHVLEVKQDEIITTSLADVDVDGILEESQSFDSYNNQTDNLELLRLNELIQYVSNFRWERAQHRLTNNIVDDATMDLKLEIVKDLNETLNWL